jgi:hypothetical protein
MSPDEIQCASSIAIRLMFKLLKILSKKDKLSGAM